MRCKSAFHENRKHVSGENACWQLPSYFNGGNERTGVQFVFWRLIFSVGHSRRSSWHNELTQTSGVDNAHYLSECYPALWIGDIVQTNHKNTTFCAVAVCWGTVVAAYELVLDVFLFQVFFYCTREIKNALSGIANVFDIWFGILEEQFWILSFFFVIDFRIDGVVQTVTFDTNH